jgi:hypothetical protein
MMFLHDKNSGIIIPFPVHLIWVFRTQIVLCSIAFCIIGPILASFIPQPVEPTPAQKAQALKNWRPQGCRMPTNKRDIEFCRSFKGL